MLGMHVLTFIRFRAGEDKRGGPSGQERACPKCFAAMKLVIAG